MSMTIPTPHNEAKMGEIAKTVLMPGDPLRAKVVAETYLTDVTQYNGVRGMNGYTGFYKGKRVSVQGSGMGIPSMGIYSYELYHFYGVESIIRIGSAGAISDDLAIGDIVIAQGACTDSNYAHQYHLPGTFAPISSYDLMEKSIGFAKEIGATYKVGNVFSSDTFYDDANSLFDWEKMGVLCVEMESAALFMNAARAGKKALTILTISDCPKKGLAASAEERQNSFKEMMEIALETAE